MNETRPRIDPLEAASRAGVRVRAREPEDALRMSEAMSDPSVIYGTMQLPYASNAARAERWKTHDPLAHVLIAESLESGELVGSGGLHRNPRPRAMHTALIGMSVIEPWQGKGVGTALMAAIVELADNWLQLRRLVLEVNCDNEPAIALYKKFGFEIEGTLRGDIFRAGEYIDCYTMARLRNF